MLGLPKETEIKKRLPKTQFFATFDLSSKQKNMLDQEISTLTLIHQLDALRLNVVEGEKIKAIFVLHVKLKTKEYNPKGIEFLAKNIPQNLIFLLEYENQTKLAIFYDKRLFETNWSKPEQLILQIDDGTLDAIWENFISQIGCFTVEVEHSLEEQIRFNELREKLEKELSKLNKRVKNVNDPKKRFEIFNRVKEIERKLQEL